MQFVRKVTSDNNSRHNFVIELLAAARDYTSAAVAWTAASDNATGQNW